ncbi:hypothetical protein POM88_012918 [Heracleum sosnowskyi]|uniref:Ubiquitin-like protease family profile domain-containing protein n=1 Tax=Heracleum sosnowskyi TaxID=360622 RepID=A0AAD8IXB1_9APIA|nr:hypothetical protein POM88_012918 [Heracleum sosnowskyi]
MKSLIRDEDPKAYYGKIPSILHSHFVKYLQWKGFQIKSHIVRKLKPLYLSMPWQTKRNSNDCGIFLMRHMETYKGDPKNWEADLRKEGSGQYKQIFKLRAKYNNAILSSGINEKKNKVITEAQDLFKDDAQHTLIKVAKTKVGNAEGSNKKATRRG